MVSEWERQYYGTSDPTEIRFGKGWRNASMQNLRNHFNKAEIRGVRSRSKAKIRRDVYLIGEDHVDGRGRRASLEDVFTTEDVIKPRRFVYFEEVPLGQDTTIGAEDPIAYYLMQALWNYADIMTGQRLGGTRGFSSAMHDAFKRIDMWQLFEYAPALHMIAPNVNKVTQADPFSLALLSRFQPHVPADVIDKLMTVAKMVHGQNSQSNATHAAWQSAYTALMDYRAQGMARRLLTVSRQVEGSAPFVLIVGQFHLVTLAKYLRDYGFRVTEFDKTVPADAIIPIILRRANWLFAFNRTITAKREAENKGVWAPNREKQRLAYAEKKRRDFEEYRLFADQQRAQIEQSKRFL